MKPLESRLLFRAMLEHDGFDVMSLDVERKVRIFAFTVRIG
jgi:hypothetical protein